MKFFVSILLSCFIIFNANFAQSKYELRGAWIATVANIDWPSSNNLTSGQQISELVTMFDKLEEAGINAVFFQIRTECDALYESRYEPWSYYITGTQGAAPDPYYDPLEFAISEAHSRGMELHAWFNPYRALRSPENYETDAKHVTKTNPEWILNFGDYQMLDPGLPTVRRHVLNIVSDVITRYDLDGIHFDDYFYPYTPKVSNEDSVTFEKFNRDITNVDDWRRDNINLLMKDIYAIINSVKPYVKFGISPFGIVENHYAGTDGFNSYSILYCDPLDWLENKYVDYVNPQLYWEIGHEKADYAKLLPWWDSVTNGRHLYIGQFSSRFASESYAGTKSEIGDQLRMNRLQNNVMGEVFFSAKSISENFSGLADSLKNDWYKYPAIPPKMLWKDAVPPLAPRSVEAVYDTVGVHLTWEKPLVASDGDCADYYLIYKFEDSEFDYENPANIIAVVDKSNTTFYDTNIDPTKKEINYAISSVDKLDNESYNKTSIIVQLEK